MKLLIDLKKYQEKEFLISGIALAVGSILLIAFFVSFSIYIDSENKAIVSKNNYNCTSVSSVQKSTEQSTTISPTSVVTSTTIKTTIATTVTIPKTTTAIKIKSKTSVKSKKTTERKHTMPTPTTVVTTMTYPATIKTTLRKPTYAFKAKPIKEKNAKKTKVMTTNNKWGYKVVTNKKGVKKNKK